MSPKETNMKKIAVILCGSGFRDGSEIRESVAVLWALSASGVQADCFAPDAQQKDVVNCLTNKTAEGESRNLLVEAARIARGKIAPLSQLFPSQYHAVIIPGGFGVAKNLCTFALQGSQGTIRSDVKDILMQMHDQRKPIGAVCIAPAVVALAFKGKNFELTVGESGETASEIEKLGHKHVPAKANECHVDKINRIVSTPAYMYDSAPLHEVFTGIQKLVNEVVAMV